MKKSIDCSQEGREKRQIYGIETATSQTYSETLDSERYATILSRAESQKPLKYSVNCIILPNTQYHTQYYY